VMTTGTPVRLSTPHSLVPGVHLPELAADAEAGDRSPAGMRRIRGEGRALSSSDTGPVWLLSPV
jgi:hypothetical protein